MSKDSMCHEVETWLKLVYKGDLVPTYEKSDEFLAILHGLQKSLTESQKISTIYFQDLISKTEEYETRVQKMRSCFDSAYLEPSCLEHAGQTTLRHLSSCACTLNLKDLNDTSYLLAMTKLKQDQLALESERKKEDILHRKIRDSIVALIARTELLETKLALIGDQPQIIAAEMEKLKQNTSLYDNNSVDFSREIPLNEDQLKSVGLEPTMLHSTLVKQSLKLREMERKCDALSAKLGRFQGLPANRDLAIAEVEKLKEEIRGLDLKLLSAATKNAD